MENVKIVILLNFCIMQLKLLKKQQMEFLIEVASCIVVLKSTHRKHTPSNLFRRNHSLKANAGFFIEVKAST